MSAIKTAVKSAIDNKYSHCIICGNILTEDERNIVIGIYVDTGNIAYSNKCSSCLKLSGS